MVIRRKTKSAAKGTVPINISPAARVPSSRLSKLTESLKLEHQLLRAPFEHYRKTIRAKPHVLEKNITHIVSGICALADSDWSKNDTVSQLTGLVSRLQDLRRMLEEGNSIENLQIHRCQARIDHLDSVDAENVSGWKHTRINRILVDYMLRNSYYEAASKLAETYNIQELVDIHIFREAKKVIDALMNKKVAPALAWFTDNKQRKKRSKRKFEFHLRVQEFIEMVRVDTPDSYKQALQYARKYLAPWGRSHLRDLKQVIATLAYRRNTECKRYKAMFDQKRWDFLVDQFNREFWKLNGMTLKPLLNIYLQAGLSALKTPYGYEEGCTKEDPLSMESFRELAHPLPYSKEHNSKLVCYITKEVMDSHNPPQALPNGYVYSTKALKEMAEQKRGTITCPRTGLVCNYTDLLKMYIS